MSKKQHTIKNNVTCTIQPRRIKSFLDSELKDFGLYVIENRALPNIMDGLRTGARKILYASMTGDAKSGKKTKMMSLVGDSLKLRYAHGDASLVSTIVNLGSKHTFNIAPLDIIGQSSTLRVPECATAPRYLSLQINKKLDIFKQDIELTQRLITEGEVVEPRYFLPIIPVALLQRTSSPGFGFSYKSFSYSLDSVIDATIETVINGGCNGIGNNHIELIPQIEGIKNERLIYNKNKQCWYNVGDYEINVEKDLLLIKDLPFNVSYEKFEEQLETLKENGYITDYQNRTNKSSIAYVVIFSKGRLKSLYTEKWKFYKNFKLYSKLPKLTLNLLDKNGKTIINFETPQDLVKAFVERRFEYYEQRKTKLIDITKQNILNLSNKAKFIQLVVDDKLIISKRKESEIKKDMDNFKLSYDLLKMSISKLTEEEIIKLQKEIENEEKYLTYLQNETTKNMYISDLVEMKQKYCEIISMKK